MKNLHPNAIRGIKLFNQGAYFEAHEELEIAWRAEKTVLRNLYRGILQVGVAYYHIQRKNYHGGTVMLARALNWLTPFPEDFYGIDLNTFVQDIKEAQSTLEKLGEEKIGKFPIQLFKTLPLNKQEDNSYS